MSRGLISAFALALVVVAAGPAAGASAAIVGLEQVAPASVTNSANKAMTAHCPAGKRVVGAGADVTPGSGQVLIDEIRPSADLTSVTVHAIEDQTGTTDNWYVAAYATCAYAPPGLELVSATSVVNSANKAPLPATCPAGKRLLGGAGDINPANGQVLFDDITPNSALTSVSVSAVEDEDGYAGNWSVTAYAICSAPIAGLVRSVVTSALDSSVSKVIQAPCPAGKQVLGGGGTMDSPNGQIILDAMYTNPALTSFGYAAWEDETANSANWSLTAYAMCANSAELVTITTARDSEDLKEEYPRCPAGHWPTGGGYDISGGLGEVSGGFAPDPSAQPGFNVFGLEDFSRTTRPWSLSAYAICGTPYPGATTIEAYSTALYTTASCPTGMRVFGTGARPAVPDFDNFTQAARPSIGLTTVTASATQSDTGAAAEPGAYAMCATALPGLQLVTQTSVSDSEEVKYATATCPAGKHLVGTGGEIVGAPGEVVLDDVRPNPALTTVTVTGAENETGFHSDWFLRAYAICVPH